MKGQDRGESCSVPLAPGSCPDADTSTAPRAQAQSVHGCSTAPSASWGSPAWDRDWGKDGLTPQSQQKGEVQEERSRKFVLHVKEPGCNPWHLIGSFRRDA